MDLALRFILVGMVISSLPLISWAKETATEPTSKIVKNTGTKQRNWVDGRELPRLELGVTGGFYNLPHYPGSKQTMNRTLFLPYFIYRGDQVKLDRNGGVRLDLLTADTYSIDVSANGSFSSNSSDNDARRGMEDIDWIGEIGPRLAYHFQKPSKSKARIDLNLPVRALFSTDVRSGEDRGLVFSPNLVYRRSKVFHTKLTFLSVLNVTFATRKLMDYFYQVEAKDVTASRPAYNAIGGYLSSQILAGFAYQKTPKLVLFAGGRYSNFDGAANEKSPLLTTKSSSAIGIGFAWTFYATEAKVKYDWKSEIY